MNTDMSASALQVQFEHDLILNNETLKKKQEELLRISLSAAIVEKEMYLSELRLVKSGAKDKVGGKLFTEQQSKTKKMNIDEF